jgi:hypothetical protein
MTDFAAALPPVECLLDPEPKVGYTFLVNATGRSILMTADEIWAFLHPR